MINLKSQIRQKMTLVLYIVLFGFIGENDVKKACQKLEKKSKIPISLRKIKKYGY